jgi:hypothetical protein
MQEIEAGTTSQAAQPPPLDKTIGRGGPGKQTARCTTSENKDD